MDWMRGTLKRAMGLMGACVSKSLHLVVCSLTPVKRVFEDALRPEFAFAETRMARIPTAPRPVAPRLASDFRAHRSL
jgi:hypothetical protein